MASRVFSSIVKHKGRADLQDLDMFVKLEQVFDFGYQPDPLYGIYHYLMLYGFLKAHGIDIFGETSESRRFSELMTLEGLDEGIRRDLSFHRSNGDVFFSDVSLPVGRESINESDTEGDKGASAINMCRERACPFRSDPVVNYVPGVRVEERSIRAVMEGFSDRRPVLSILPPGIRIQSILDTIAAQAGLGIDRLDGSSFTTVESFFGGQQFREFLGVDEKHVLEDLPGIFRRYMVRNEDWDEALPARVIVDVPNFSGIPEWEVVSLFDFLNKGTWTTVDETGKEIHWRLRKEVYFHFSCAKEDLGDNQTQTALKDRLRLIHHQTPPVLSDIESGRDGDFERMLKGLYGVEDDACMILRVLLHNLQKVLGGAQTDEVLIHIGDVYRIAGWYSMAKEETVDDEKRIQLLFREMDRYLRSRFKGDMIKIYEEVVRAIKDRVSAVFPQGIDLSQDAIWAGALNMVFDKDTGLLREVMGVPVHVGPKAKSFDEVFTKDEVTLVPELIWTFGLLARAIKEHVNQRGFIHWGEILLLIGPSSIGKTTGPGCFARLLGRDWYTYSMTPESSPEDLTIVDQPNPEAGAVYYSPEGSVRIQGQYSRKFQLFLEHWSRGDVVMVIDELDIKPSMADFFRSLLEGIDTIVVDRPSEEPLVYKKGKNVLVVMGMNSVQLGKFSGRKELPVAFKNRITIEHKGGYSRESLQQISRSRMGLATKIPQIDFRKEELASDEDVSGWTDKSMPQDMEELDDAKIKEILGQIKAKGLQTEEDLKVTEHYLNEIKRRQETLRIIQDNVDKLRMLKVRVKGWEYGKIKVSRIIVSQAGASFNLEEGILNVNAKELGEHPLEVLLGTMRHEVLHAILTRNVPEKQRLELVQAYGDGVADDSASYFAQILSVHPVLHRLVNMIEDVSINTWDEYMQDRLGARWPADTAAVIKAMVSHEYGSGLWERELKKTEEEREKRFKKKYIVEPFDVFTWEFFVYSLTGRYSPDWEFIPPDMKEAIIAAQQEWNDICMALDTRFDPTIVQGSAETIEKAVFKCQCALLKRLFHSQKVLTKFIELYGKERLKKEYEEVRRLKEECKKWGQVEEEWVREAKEKGLDPAQYVKEKQVEQEGERDQAVEEAIDEGSSILKELEESGDPVFKALQERLVGMQERLQETDEIETQTDEDADTFWQEIDQEIDAEEEGLLKMFNGIQDLIDKETPVSQEKRGIFDAGKMDKEEMKALLRNIIQEELAKSQTPTPAQEASRQRKYGYSQSQQGIMKASPEEIFRRSIQSLLTQGEAVVKRGGSGLAQGSVNAEQAAAMQVVQELRDKLGQRESKEDGMGSRSPQQNQIRGKGGIKDALDRLEQSGRHKGAAQGEEGDKTSGKKKGSAASVSSGEARALAQSLGEQPLVVSLHIEAIVAETYPKGHKAAQRLKTSLDRGDEEFQKVHKKSGKKIKPERVASPDLSKQNTPFEHKVPHKKTRARDVVIYIDLSSSLSGAVEQIKRMTSLMMHMLGASGGINIRVVGLTDDEENPIFVFKGFNKPQQVVTKKEVERVMVQLSKRVGREGGHFFEAGFKDLENLVESRCKRNAETETVAFFISDGEDNQYFGSRSLSPESKRIDAYLEKKRKTRIIGIGVSDSSAGSEAMGIFDRRVKGITNYDVITDIVLRIITAMDKRRKIPQGDLDLFCGLKPGQKDLSVGGGFPVGRVAPVNLQDPLYLSMYGQGGMFKAIRQTDTDCLVDPRPQVDASVSAGHLLPNPCDQAA